MAEAERIALVKKILNEFAAGSADLLLDSVTDDVVLRLTVQPGTPLSGEFVGKDGLARYFANNDEVVESSNIQVTDVLAGGDKVVALGSEDLGIKRTGAVEPGSAWATVFSFRGDKIAEILTIEDTAPIAQAYGQPVS